MMRHYLLLFSLLFVSNFLNAQRIDSFPENPNEFIGPFETFMLASGIKEVKKEFEDFKVTFIGGGFTEEEQKVVIEITNTMKAKRMSSSPYFRSYLSALLLLKQNDTESKHFNSWNKIVAGFLADDERSNREFKLFIDFSIDFFETNTIRYSKSGTSWACTSNDFTFQYLNKIPFLQWENTDLIAYRKLDTMRIINTAGSLNPLEETWSGNQGRVNWDSSGLEGEIYVNFDRYQLDLKKSFYEIDSVEFHSETFFGARAVSGSFTDKITSQVAGSLPSYPRFESSEGNLKIDNFGKGVEYTGGFSLYGGTIYGTAAGNTEAMVRLLNQKSEMVFSARSERFAIKQGTELSAQDVSAVFYYKNDSIAHPSVNLRVDIKTGDLELNRGDSGSDRNPFFSSSHNVNIHAENIIANLNSDSILLGKKSARILKKEPVSFESLNYFSQLEYDKLQGLSSVNPLVVLMRVYKQKGEAKFIPAKAIGAAYGGQISEENLAAFLYNLSKKGFVDYNATTGMVEIKEKVKHYAESNFGQRDYDLISIVSDTLDVNAYLSIGNNAIAIRGVKQLELSPFRRVGLLPTNNTVILYPGMNLEFAGTLFAGFTDFNGKDFHFDYNSFQVKMDSIERFRFFPPAKDPVAFPNTPAYALTSDIENTSGTLYIDKTDNKSGKDSIPDFSIFKTEVPSFIYYDDSVRVADTSYTRDSFYFKLEPFELKTLGNYMKEDLAFDGSLISAGIFPAFNQTAIVREDFSLGFEHETPNEGFPIYGDMGRYIGTIDLSNKGLQGKGTLDYLGASIQSEDFFFRPKNTTGSAESFDVPESRGGEVETPLVHADAVKINWLPYKDSLYIESDYFQIFQGDDYSFNGLLTLTPSGVKGQGDLSWAKAQVSSDIFSFGANSVSSDTMSVAIKSMEGSDAIALRTDNLNGTIDFDEKIGQFQGNDTSYVALTHNQYISSMNAFKWDLENEDLALERANKGLGDFISTVSGQDSLIFKGRNARIDLKTNDLIVSEVPFINSADALIYPDSNQIIVNPGGKMATFTNATIVVDSIRKRHKITNAEVNILGRKSYQAKGLYQYDIAGKQQQIEFSDIVGDRVGKGKISLRPTATRASGTVEIQDSFLIDEKTAYYGEIGLSSENIDLQFQGFAKLQADKLPEKSWFGINCSADKDNLVIPYNYPRDDQGFQVFTGFYLGRDVPFIYPKVMSPPYTLQDRKILDVTGVFKYDKKKDAFIFGDSAKVIGVAAKGNQLIFDNKTGKLNGEGKLGIADKLEFTSLDAVGSATTSFVEVPDSLKAQTPPPPLEVEIMAGVKFSLPERLFRYVLAEAEANNLSMTAIPYLADQTKYKKQLSMLFPAGKELNEAFNGMALGKVDLPSKMNDYTFLVTDLQMKWDMDYQSFVSTSPNVGLISVNGKPVNKRIEAYVEYKMPSVGGDRFYYYFKFPSQIFYYFGYKQGVLEIYSNNPQFMDAAAKMKKSELVTKMPGGETYEILVETASRSNMFVRRVQAARK